MGDAKRIALEIFALLIHLIIAFIFFGIVFVVNGLSYPGDSIVKYNIFYVLGSVIVVLAVIQSIKRTFTTYLLLFSITAGTIALWMALIASMDMRYLLLLYLILSVPIIIIKHSMESSKHP